MIAIYARVSTEEQAKRGFSLQDQVRECKRKAGTNEVITYVDEGISGEFLDRPQLGKLREDLRRGGITAVICLDPDRLSRKLMNQLIISDEIEARASLIFVSGDYARTPEGQLFYQMRGAISQFEKAKINERMSRGRKEKARQGRVLRDFRMYGYDFDPSRDCFVINEREAMIVRLAFDLFTQQTGQVKGINGIARYFTEIGVPTKRGARVFHRQVVRQMLMNRAYIGEFHQNRWNTEGMLGNRYRVQEERIKQRERPQEEWIRLSIPAIVSVEIFAQAQSLLAESRRRFAGISKDVYLLGGLLRCAECDNTMTGVNKNNWGTKKRYYTDVKHTVGSRHPGCGLYLSCRELDHLVWQSVLVWMGEPDSAVALILVAGESSPMGEVQAQMKAQLDMELARLRDVSSRTLGLLAAPGIDEEDIREKLREISVRRSSLQRQREDLTLRLKHEQTAEDRSCAREANIASAWRRLSAAGADKLRPHAQKLLIRTVVKEIRVSARGDSVEIVTF